MKTNYIEDILKSIGAEEVPPDVQKIAEQTSMDFSKTLTESEQPKRHILWEYLSKSQISKLAAAVVIVIAVLFGLNILGHNDVAWGEVLNNIQKVGAFAYRMKLNMVGILDEKESVELGVESWLRTKGYLSIPDRVAVTIIPSEKTYLRMTLTDELFEKVQKDICDPRKLVEEFMKYEYTKLGRSKIDGIEVEGIECRNPGIARGVAAEIAGLQVGYQGRSRRV